MLDSEIFKAAVKLAPEQRAAYLDQACGANHELHREVESLLRAHDDSAVFLQELPGRLPETANYPAIAERPGAVIGPYKLMEQIGEGGFALVFVAEQQQPVRRKVAVKIIKPGMDTREVIARFEAERQALAMMDHPNIARVFDAGTTETGRPYFVMELVKGIPISDYCDQRQLTARERLELFRSVCQAVQHAHGKGIIHRDLKPANILVAPHDGVPIVKVIDFGIAKAMGQRFTEKTIYTRFAQMIGTPLYMSPEQAEINALDVDIRSDVYSLGVLLYELLTGTTPFHRERFATAAYDEIRRILKEEEPPKPSTRLSTLGEVLQKVSAQRNTVPAQLSALVRGELDWIVMTCLEKDRNRRYETASGLARDIERYLRDEPIEAYPPSFGYRLRKFAGKHKRTLAIAVAFVALLLAGAGLSTWQAVRATNAAARAQALNRFLTDQFLTEVAPGRNPQDRPITLEQILEKAAPKIDQVFDNQPELAASLHHTFGATYCQLAFWQQAQLHLEKARAVRRALYGSDGIETMDTSAQLAYALQFQGRVSDAERIYRENLTASKRRFGAEHPATLNAMNNLASHFFYVRRLDESETLYRECLDLKRRRLGPDDDSTLSTAGNLAIALHHAGKLSEAETLFRSILEVLRRDYVADDLRLLNVEQNFFQLLKDQGNLTEAALLGRQNLEAYRRVYGVDHPWTDISLGNVWLVTEGLLKSGQPALSEPCLREYLITKEQRDPDDWSTFNAKSVLGGVLLGQKKYDESEPLLLAGYEGMKQREAKIPGESKIHLTEAIQRLVEFYEATGDKSGTTNWRERLKSAKNVVAEPPSDP